MATLLHYPTGKTLHNLTGHSNKITGVNFLNDREKCITSSADRNLKVWDLKTGFCTETFYLGSPIQVKNEIK